MTRINANSPYRSSLIILAVGATFFSVSAIGEQTTELPPVFRASDILPASTVAGPHHRVAEAVYNNGVLNQYELTTRQGTYAVIGTQLLKTRLEELRALQQMEKFKASKAYRDTFGKAVTAPIKGAADLVTSPIQTTKGAARGVGSFIGNIGHSLFGGASEYESGAFKRALGFDTMKRKFAYEFGVDPYTSFPPVKDRLNEIAWSATAGGLTVKLATAAIPSPAKVAVTVPSFTRGMNQLLRDKTPAELKKINDRKLARMNVHKSLAEVFLEHPKYSPSHKTYIVGALELMDGVQGRSTFIQRATLDQDEYLVFFRQRQAMLLAGYHQNVAKATKLLKLGNTPFLMRNDGKIIGVIPIDHLAWTSEIQNAVTVALHGISKRKDISGGELWFEGTVSPMARKRLEAQNWIVREKAIAQLMMK
jgi:hypothetical protein